MSKIIEIPKAVFENIFFADGGEKEIHQKLVGNKQFEETTETLQNANVEEGEWILDSQGLRKVMGEKHSEGGVDVHLEDGAKVLSDKGVLGKELATSLSKEYEVKLNPKNTYSEALDKINKKIGLEEVIEEQEKLVKKIDYQQKNVKDENTLSANIEVLSGKMKDLEDKKTPLQDKSIEVFAKMFEAQETKKPKDESNQGIFAEGGEQPKPAFRIANMFENWDYFKHQNEVPSSGSGVFGKEINKPEAINEIKRVFPTLSAKYFKEGSNTPTNSKEFQQDTNRYYYDLLKSAENLYGVDSDKYKQIASEIERERFTDGAYETDVRSFDGKFGNFTSTRPNYELELLPEDVHKKVKEAGVNTIGQLREKFPEEYKTYIDSLDFTIPDDAWLGKTTVNADGSELLDEVVIEVDKKETTTGKKIEDSPQQTRMGVLNTPDQTPMVPQGMDAHLKTSRRYERLDFRDISPEQQLMELNKLTERAENNLDMMPEQQKASLSANLLATQADQTNKILSQTNQFNTQGQQQIDNLNAQIQVQENNANAQDALNYEQRQLLAEAKTIADYNNFHNTVQRNNLMNYNQINDLNLSNALYDHFQFTDQGVEAKGNRAQFGVMGANGLTPEQKFEADVKRKMEEEDYATKVAREAKNRLKNNKRFGE